MQEGRYIFHESSLYEQHFIDREDSIVRSISKLQFDEAGPENNKSSNCAEEE